MWNWLSINKKWFFSGIGVFLITLILTLIDFSNNNSQQNIKTDEITNSTVIQGQIAEKGDVNIYNNSSTSDTYFPLPPPDLAEEYTLTEKDIKVNIDDSSCIGNSYYNVIVADSEIESFDNNYDDDYSSKVVKLIEKDGITYEYVLHLKEVPRAYQVPLKPIFIKGRRLRVGVYFCGTGNFRYLAYVKVLKGTAKFESN